MSAFPCPRTLDATPGRLASRRPRARPTGLAGRLVLVALLASPLPALAVSSPADMLPDPALEQRARDIGREIRCMVCQNQSIEDSEVGLARDLRLIVRERVAAGDSDQEVRGFLHARYGDFVLLRPPFSWSTAILWATPVLAVLAGLGLIIGLRRRIAALPPAPAPLTEEERRRLAELDGGGDTTRA